MQQILYMFPSSSIIQPAEKGPRVITNLRCLRARDLLVARKSKKKQIPHAVQKRNRASERHIFVFPQPQDPDELCGVRSG